MSEATKINPLRRISRDTGIIFTGTLFAVIFGILRESITAGWFGLTSSADALFAAMIFPLFLFTMFLSSFSSMFVNVYKEILHGKSPDETASFLSNYFIVYGGLIFILSLLLALPARFIITLVATLPESAAPVAVKLFVMFMAVAYLQSMVNLFNSFFQAEKKFSVISISKILNGFTMIVILVPAIKYYGIYGVALSFLGGQFLSFIYLVYSWLKIYPFRPGRVNIVIPSLKRTLLLGLPLVIVSIFNQLNFVVDQKMASGLETGALAGLYFSNKLVIVPHALISLSVGTVFYPGWVEKSLADKTEHLRTNFIRSIKGSILLMWPLACGIILLRKEIIEVLFQHGIFSDRATARCASILGCYALGLFFVPLNSLALGLFRSLAKMKLLVILGGLTILLNVAGNLFFMSIWGVPGIALSTSLINLIWPFICFPIIRKHLGHILEKKDVYYCAKICFSFIVMSITVFLLRDYLPGFNRYARLLFLSGAGAGVYFSVLEMLGLSIRKKIM